MSRPGRGTIAYWAFWGHRLSGLALALFLPLHLFVLGLALEDLDQFLAFAENPLVKFAEWGLVSLFTIHLLFGLRLLAIDWRPRPDARQSWIVPSFAIASVTGVLFLAVLIQG